MNYKKALLLITLLLSPITVFASSSSSEFTIGSALLMEAFCSIHMSVFVLMPLSKIFCPANSKRCFLTLFIIRAVILLIFDIFITPMICIIDFISIFIGAFLIVPISIGIGHFVNKHTIAVATKNSQTTSIATVQNNTGLELHCTKCNGKLLVTDKFCPSCGAPFSGDNVSVSISKTATAKTNEIVKTTSFDPIYLKSEQLLVEEFIKKELLNQKVDMSTKLIPQTILKKRKVFKVLFCLLLFLYISMIFFHFPYITYIVGLIILIIFFCLTRKYNLTKLLIKEIKARPSEKISTVIKSTINTMCEDTSGKILLPGIIIAVIAPLFIFYNPRIMYESYDNGYSVRFYTFGLTNLTTATIPAEHNSKPVLSLRGNTFSNMPFLREVTLPNTIVEIRGQAFKNDISLTKVNIPNKLEYLGGGAFYNCSSITSIELPDTLTYMGGEVFYHATALESIKLSNQTPEIRGSSFEECHSLKSITIPDSVTRIGGHAFYNNYNLREVILTENSKLMEIGSSAFRLCSSLYEITIPKATSVNYRAFKESPTDVLRFGELNYGHLIDSSKYTNKTFMYLQSNQTEPIASYRTDKKIQNASISLDNCVCKSNDCVYYLTYKDDTITTEIIFDRNNPYKYINDNVAIEASSEYQFSYSSSLSVNVYYN